MFGDRGGSGRGGWRWWSCGPPCSVRVTRRPGAGRASPTDPDPEARVVPDRVAGLRPTGAGPPATPCQPSGLAPRNEGLDTSGVGGANTAPRRQAGHGTHPLGGSRHRGLARTARVRRSAQRRPGVAPGYIPTRIDTTRPACPPIGSAGSTGRLVASSPSSGSRSASAGRALAVQSSGVQPGG